MPERRRSLARRGSAPRRRDTAPRHQPRDVAPAPRQPPPREVLLTVQPDPRMTLVKVRKLGEGAQGTAHLVRDKRTGAQFVAKKTKNMIDTFRGLPYEAYILGHLLPPHPNIVRLINYDYEPGGQRRRGWIDEEFDALYNLCSGGNLSAIVYDHHKGGWVPESFGRDFHSRMDRGGVYRGAKPVVHRDIKPDNIFLATEYKKGMKPGKYPDVVLGDFGLATTEEYPDCGGTISYLPPERESSRAADVWSLGSVIHFLVFGNPPSMMPHARRVMDHWEGNPKTRRTMYLPRFYSEELDDVLMECLQYNPRMRIDSWSLFKRIRRDAPLSNRF